MRLFESIRFFAWFLNPLAVVTQASTVPRCYAHGLVKHVSTEGSQLHVIVHHERIEEFPERDGTLHELGPLTMVFRVAKGVGREVMREGARIAFAFEVDWSRESPLTIVRAEPLAEGIALKLSC